MLIVKSPLSAEYLMARRGRKREPNLYGRAFTPNKHCSAGVIGRREFALEWTGAKIDRWKRKPGDIGDDQAISRIDQGHIVRRLKSPCAAKFVDRCIVTSECPFITTPDRIRNHGRQTGDWLG